MGKWHPRFAPKQLDMYESPARTKVAVGPRYTGKTWAFQHLVLQHCWRHEARFAIVPKTNRVAEAGIWTSLLSQTYPEWAAAGICSDKADFGWTRPPWTNPLTKVMTAELWNRHGTKSQIQVFPVQHLQEAKDKFFSTEFSGAWISEAHLWPTDEVYTAVCDQLRLPGVRYEDQLVLLDANPPESGRRHWLYTGFIDPSPFPEDLPKEDRQHAEYERGLTKVWHFYQEDNPHGDPNVMRGYNTRYAKNPLAYRRFVRGEWLDGTEEDLCFKSVWDPNTMVVGNADSIREEDWQVLCPSNGLHVNRRGGKVCLVDGWDVGDVNHAWVGIQPWMNKDGKLCFDVLDEHVVVNQKTSVKAFADEAHQKIQLLEQLADFPVTWDGYTDSSAEQFRASMDLPSDADATDGAIIETVIQRRLTGSHRVKTANWQKRRVDFLAELLQAGRIRVSAQCFWVAKMFEKLRKDTSPKSKTYLAGGQDEKHVFDALSYPIAMLCIEELLSDTGPKVKPRVARV